MVTSYEHEKIWCLFLMDCVYRIKMSSLGSIRTYFKTLKARRKRAMTQKRIDSQPEVSNELEESVIAARRNQRCHNVSKLFYLTNNAVRVVKIIG